MSDELAEIEVDSPFAKPRQLQRTTKYESNWIRVHVDRVLFPTGKIVEEFHVIDYTSDAVAAVIENERGQVLLARVYRYATDSVEWEIPGGRRDEGEEILETARREAWEETGYETRDHRWMYSFHPVNGISNVCFHAVHCHAAEKTGELDPHEVAATQWFSAEEIREMLRTRKIVNGFTLTALLMWLSGMWTVENYEL